MGAIEKRIRQDGKARYRVKIRRKGLLPITGTFSTAADARKFERLTERELELGKHLPLVEAKQHSLSDAIQRYRETVLSRKALHTITQQAQQLAWWESRIGYLTLDRVTAGVISQLRDELAAQYAPATVNHYFAPLRHLCSTAVIEWAWMPENPTIRVKRLTEPRGRDRYLSDGERIRLFDACQASAHPHLYTLVVLAIATGARKSELKRLKWSQVDPRYERITLTETKNREVRVLPIVGLARDLLRQHGRNRIVGIPWVFPGVRGRGPTSITRAWKKVLAEAGIENFKWHDLRHTTGSYLAMMGASDREIGEILGHKSAGMARRYSHLSAPHTTGLIERMNERYLS